MELCAPVRGAAELISRWAFGCRLVGSRPFKAGNRLLGGGGGTAHPWLSPRAGLCLRPRTAQAVRGRGACYPAARAGWIL